MAFSTLELLAPLSVARSDSGIVSDPEALGRDIQAGFAQYRKEHCPPYTFATSVGIAQYKPGQSLESLIEEADDALYKVKQRKKVGR